MATFAGPAGARGLAVLCGWGGGRLHHVQKHAVLWHRIGWRTATVCMDMDMTFFPARWTRVPAVAREVMEACDEHRASRPDSLIASHAFSNGGMLMQLALMQDDAVTFDGSVYDSGPSYSWIPLPLGAPMVLTVSGLPVSEIARGLARHVPYAILATLAFPFVALPPPLGRFPSLFSASTNAPRPELFVYGQADYVIPPSHIESFIRKRQDHGADVHVLGPLPNSPHCSHLRMHREAYAQALEDFTRLIEA